MVTPEFFSVSETEKGVRILSTKKNFIFNFKGLKPHELTAGQAAVNSHNTNSVRETEIFVYYTLQSSLGGANIY